MRHRKRHSKLNMMTAHRKATMRNMVINLLKFQRIETTLARAKEARRLAEHIISISKDDTVFARRRVYEVIPNRDLIKKLFKEITPLFKDRTSGFTRIIHSGFRRGDGADMAILELTEKKIVEKLPKKKKSKAEEVKSEAVKETKKSEAREAAKDEQKKEETKIRHTPKAKPTLAEEKMQEKAKSEDKKLTNQRGFMKNLRGIFRKRGDR